MAIKVALLALALLSVGSNAEHKVEHPHPGHERPDHAMTFDEFLVKFGKSYAPAEFKARRAIFHSTLEAVHAHNDKADKSFHLGINKFADMTEVRLGRRKQGRETRPLCPPFSLLQMALGECIAG